MTKSLMMVAPNGACLNNRNCFEVPITLEVKVAITRQCFDASYYRVGLENSRINSGGVSWLSNAASVTTLYKELSK